jgi:hypothetical protein
VGSPERIYRGSVRAFSIVFIALGVLILATTLAHGGGPLSIGTLLGVVFIAVGAARLWLSGNFRGWRRGGGPPRRGGASSPEHRGGGHGDRTRGRTLP